MENAMAEKNYESKDIVVLEGLDAVRLRPPPGGGRRGGERPRPRAGRALRPL